MAAAARGAAGRGRATYSSGSATSPDARGTGFLADGDGTMVTSHEAVDGLARLVLHAPGGQLCLVEAAAITALPEQGLALVATEGLSVPPQAVAAGGPAHPERRVRVRLPARHRRARCWARPR